MLTYILLEIVSIGVALVALGIILFQFLKYEHLGAFLKRKSVYIPILLLIISGITGLLSNRTYPPDFAMPFFSYSHAPGGLPPNLPFANIFKFFAHKNDFEKVADIGADPNAVPY